VQNVMQQIGQAMCHLHRCGIVHSMLSLDSIYINESNQPIIAHFWNSVLFDQSLTTKVRSANTPIISPPLPNLP